MNPDLAAAIVAESHRTPEAAVDLLLEMEATLCDVLLLYAGTPPDWEDGLPQEVLCEWLKRTGDDERAAKVRGHYLLEIGELNVEWCVYTWEYPEYYTRWPTESAARRHLKRQVLGLFPEVETLQLQDWGLLMPVMVAAPDWIPLNWVSSRIPKFAESRQ